MGWFRHLWVNGCFSISRTLLIELLLASRLLQKQGSEPFQVNLFCCCAIGVSKSYQLCMHAGDCGYCCTSRTHWCILNISKKEGLKTLVEPWLWINAFAGNWWHKKQPFSILSGLDFEKHWVIVAFWLVKSVKKAVPDWSNELRWIPFWPMRPRDLWVLLGEFHMKVLQFAEKNLQLVSWR